MAKVAKSDTSALHPTQEGAFGTHSSNCAASLSSLMPAGSTAGKPELKVEASDRTFP